MLKKSNYRGFAVLEVFLALIVICIASVGVYVFYEHSQKMIKQDKVKRQIISLSATFSNLSNLHLTEGISTSQDLVNLFYNSNQFPEQYFNLDAGNVETVVNPYGILQFSNVSARQFSATVPVGLLEPDAQKDLCYQLNAYVTDCHPGENPNAGTISLTVNLDDQ